MNPAPHPVLTKLARSSTCKGKMEDGIENPPWVEPLRCMEEGVGD